MQVFMVLPIDGTDDADSYWVRAGSEREARRLVALNVGDAKDVEDPALFDCVPDNWKAPPEGFIYGKLSGPIPIEKR
jgi:hypothetical protein